MRFIGNHEHRGPRPLRNAEAWIEPKSDLDTGESINDLLRAVGIALGSGCRTLIIDCRGVASVNSSFPACLLVIARRVHDHAASCRLVGLTGQAATHVELHRVGHALEMAGVQLIDTLDGRPDLPTRRTG